MARLRLKARRMQHERPHIVVLAGPNGAGKSTAAPRLLNELLGVAEFVNADIIAQGLSGFAPASAALMAGRILLQRLRHLSAQKRDFAFETTLASRTLAATLSQLRKEGGYQVHLIFLWLDSPELAVARVAKRVVSGGHDVAEDVIRRRYARGLKNFFALYRNTVDTWRFYDNSTNGGPRLIARGGTMFELHLCDSLLWKRLETEYE